MKRKWRPNPKRLKNLKNMEFLGRFDYVGEFPKGWREFRDDFLHHESGLTLSRVTTVRENNELYVRWTCNSLGEGSNAGIGYWLKLAKKKCRPDK
jgi:hypothetical protein